MDSSGMNFTTFERGKRKAVAHQTGQKMMFTPKCQVFGGEKHRRVATADDNLAPYGLAVLEQSDLYPPRVGGQPQDKTVGAGTQVGQLPQPFKRTHQQATADLGDLSAHGTGAGRQGTEQLSFDDFPALFYTEQVFDAAIERSRELQGYRSGGRVLIRLKRADRLPGYSRQIRQLFLREGERLSLLAQMVFDFHLESI
jgi:hypothetical protein